jgi:hypothetical protein
MHAGSVHFNIAPVELPFKATFVMIVSSDPAFEERFLPQFDASAEKLDFSVLASDTPPKDFAEAIGDQATLLCHHVVGQLKLAAARLPLQRELEQLIEAGEPSPRINELALALREMN